MADSSESGSSSSEDEEVNPSIANAEKLPLNPATTQLSIDTAIKHYNDVMKEYGYTVGTIQPSNITIDMWRVYGVKLSKMRKSNGKPYSGQSLTEYFRKAKEAIKLRHPSIAFWSAPTETGPSGNDMCNCYANSLKKMGKSKWHFEIEDDCVALYRNDVIRTNSNILLSVKDVPKAFLNANLISDLQSGVGRGGEVKHQSWTSTQLDNTLQLVAGRWYEDKTIRSYPMAFVSDKDSAEVDWFFLKGGYFMFGGLARVGFESLPPFDRQQAYRMYPEVPNPCTTHISKLIKSNSKVDGATARSIRKGACSELLSSPEIAEKECDAVGGWMPGNSKKHYYTPSLSITIPGSMFLAGHKHVPKKVVLPELTSDFTTQEWDRIVCLVFDNISLPEFKPNGRLRPLLHVCLASILRFYEDICRKYGRITYCAPWKMIEKLREIFNSVTLADGGATGHSRLMLLSRRICTSVNNANIAVSSVERGEQGTRDILNSAASRIAIISDELIQTKNIVMALSVDVMTMTQAFEQFSVTMSNFITSKSSPTKRKYTEDASSSFSPSSATSTAPTLGAGGSSSSSTTAAAASSSSTTSTTANNNNNNNNYATNLFGNSNPPPPKKANTTNIFNSSALASVTKYVTTSTPVANVSVSNLLQVVTSRSKLDSLTSPNYSAGYAEPDKVRKVMLLINEVMTAENLTGLKDKVNDSVAVSAICAKIETQCMNKLIEWEAEAGLQAKIKSRVKANITGVAARLTVLRKFELRKKKVL